MFSQKKYIRSVKLPLCVAIQQNKELWWHNAILSAIFESVNAATLKDVCLSS